MACAASFALAGCYDSQTDLIGENSRQVVSANSILVFRNIAYVANVRGTEVQLCPLRTPSDASRVCTKPQMLKLERTISGNYIVQIFDGKSYVFGLWFVPLSRSFDQPENCLMLLGEDIVGPNLVGAVLGTGQRMSKYAEQARFQELVSSLAPYRNEHLASRDELLSVVGAYEKTVFSLVRPTCPGDAIHFGNRAGVAIQGDNRHLPAIE